MSRLTTIAFCPERVSTQCSSASGSAQGGQAGSSAGEPATAGEQGQAEALQSAQAMAGPMMSAPSFAVSQRAVYLRFFRRPSSRGQY